MSSKLTFSSLLLLSLPIVLILRFYLYRRRHHHSHGLSNLPGPEVKSWWQGNFGEAFNSRQEAWDFHLRILKNYGAVVRLDSFMGEKQLIVYDPAALHHILVKEQEKYDRTDLTSIRLVFGKGLSAITGEAHRKQKRVLNPVFSIAHMKDMLPIFYEVVGKLETGLSSKFKDGPQAQEIDMHSWMSRTAFELIGKAGLGYSFEDLTDDSVGHPYSEMLKQLTALAGRMWIIRMYLINWVVKIGPPAFRRWVMRWVPLPDLHKVRDMSDYMWELSKEILEGKRRALEEGDEAVQKQVGRGKDIMSILMRLNMAEESGNKLDEDEVLGQMSLLIFAGMGTTSTALTRVLYLLSSRPDVQEKLRQEILEARRENSDVPYDQLISLPYLDAICRETLRLFPPATNIFRHAAQDTIIPLSKPIIGLDGTAISELHVPKSTRLVISILNTNRNPAIWGPDVLEWKPERWLEPLPDELIQAHVPGVYSHLMTFNAGGRSCIGFKFSQLEMKAVLSMLIAKFRFEPSDKDIFWQMNHIVTPCLNEGDTKPRMPLMVSKLEGR